MSQIDRALHNCRSDCLIASCDRLSFDPPVRGGYASPEPNLRKPYLHWDTSPAAPIPFDTRHPAPYRYRRRSAPAGLRIEVSPPPRKPPARDARQSQLARYRPAGRGHADRGRGGQLVIWQQELPHGASPNTSGGHGCRNTSRCTPCIAPMGGHGFDPCQEAYR